MSHTLFGYPGGKFAILDHVRPSLVLADSRKRYVEPFFGGGSVGLNEMLHRRMDQYWINDIDVGVYCIWKAVKEWPQQLKELVRSYQPHQDHFPKLKQVLEIAPRGISDPQSVVRVGFVKLAIHKTTFNSLGARASQALGGAVQRKNKVGRFWKVDEICGKVDDLHEVLKSCDARITNLDWYDVLADDSVPSFVYLDPPYVEQGPDMYRHQFAASEHLRLASALRATRHLWLMSYDDCPQIRQLYDWAEFRQIDVRRKMRRGATVKELLIAPNARLLRHLSN
jgi:DNA adenine methylase